MAENRVKIVIEADGKDAEAAVKRLSGNLNDFGRKADTARGGADRLRGTMVHLVGAWVSFNAAAEITRKAFDLGKQFVDTASDAQLLRAQLVGLTGSVQKAEAGFAWLREFSFQNPIYELGLYQDAFVKFRAAGLDPTNGSLQSLIQASAAFGKEGVEVKRAVIAIQQMMGKGTISMEELRQQLGEAIPTAMRVMAREMDMTMPQFSKAVEKGAVDARTGLDALFRGLKEDYDGSVGRMLETWEGQTGRTALQWQLFQQTIMDGGAFDYLTAALTLSNDEFEKLTKYLATNREEIARLTKDAVVGLADGLIITARVVQGVGMAFDGLKLSGTGAFWALTEGGVLLYKTFEALLTPIDLVYQGMIKMGMLAADENPIDQIRQWRLSLEGLSEDLVVSMEEQKASMHDTYNGYDRVVGKLEEFRNKLAGISLNARETGVAGAAGMDTFDNKVNDVLNSLDSMKSKLKTNKDALAELQRSEEHEKERARINAEALAELERQENAWAVKAAQIDGSIFTQRRANLEQEYIHLSKFTDDKMALKIWYAQECRVIDEEEFNYKVEQATTLSEYIQARQEQDAFNLRGNLDNQRSAWEQYYQGIKGLSGSYSNILADSFSSGFFDPTTKQIGDLNESWDSLWSSMVATTIAAVAQIAAQQVVATAADWAMGAAGFVADAIFHTGTPGVKDDETVAVLQAGEMVIPRGPSQIIRDAWRESGGGTDWGSMFGSMAGMAANGGFSGGSGLSLDDPMVAELAGRFAGIGTQVAAGMTTSLAMGASFDAALNAVMGGIGTDGITGIMSGVLNVGLGNTVPLGNFLGMDITPSDFSMLTSMVIGALVGGPIGMAASVVAGPLVGLGINALADALDIRSMENVRDALETSMGWFSAQRALAGISSKLGDMSDLADLSTMADYMDRTGMTPEQQAEYAELIAMAFGVHPSQYSGKEGSWGIDGLTGSEQGVVDSFGGLGTALGDAMASALSGNGVASDSISSGGATVGGSLTGPDENANIGGGRGGGMGGSVGGLQYGGLVDSVLVPQGEDGLKPVKFGEAVIDADTTRQMLDSFKEGGAVTGGAPIIIQLISQDGKILEQHIIDGIKRRSDAGQHIVNMNGVYSKR